jgi:hypothetical protein
MRGKTEIEADLEWRSGGIRGPNRDNVAGGWRKLHNENIHNLYSSRNINRTIKSRMRWIGRVAYMGEDWIKNFGRMT